MINLPLWFIKLCTKTDLWKSDAEESRRYLKYPSYQGFDLFTWHKANFRSKWEFFGKEHLIIGKREKGNEEEET